MTGLLGAAIIMLASFGWKLLTHIERVAVIESVSFWLWRTFLGGLCGSVPYNRSFVICRW